MNCATVYDFLGKQRKKISYRIERVNKDASAGKPSVPHLIFIIDRSGSMYGVIKELISTFFKVAAIIEYSHQELLISVVSYSSEGDVTLHCDRLPIVEFMKADSKQADSVRKIHATCLTGMSQSVALAEKLVRDDEITGIVLHSDGYANDPSPSAEYRRMDEICARLSTKNVFVNTVAYSDCSDFQFLSRISAAVSGTCVKARNSKDVFDAIESACKLLVSGCGTPLEFAADGADTVIFINKSMKKLVGADGNLTVRGAGDGESVVVRISNGGDGEAGSPDQVAFVMTAYAKYCLGAGRLNEAKYAMFSSNLPDIYKKHYKALSSNQIADMCADLDSFLFTDAAHRYGEKHELPSGASVLDFLRIVDANKAHVSVNLAETLKHYKKRSVKRINGSRAEDGSLVEPAVDTEYDRGVGDSAYVKIGAVDFNRSDATVNVKIPQRVKLVDRITRKAIDSVAGIQLDLTDFRQYTVIGSGEVNMAKMVIRISSKEAFRELHGIGIVEGEFSPSSDYTIDLGSMPACGFGETVGKLPDFEEIARLSILSKFVNYMAEGKSSVYTDEQIDELKKFHLTAALNLSMPTTTPYTDLQKAISEGEIDTRTVLSVDIGGAVALNYSKFESTKKFVEKFYAPSDDFVKRWFAGESFARKALSSRTKTKKADEFQLAIYDELFGLSKPSILKKMETDYGLSGLCDAVTAHDPDRLAKVKETVVAVERAMWRDKVSPFVFYVSSTGIMPENMKVEMVKSVDDLMAKFPDLSLSKSEKEESTFFIVDGKHVVSMTRESAYFSTEKGVAKAKSMVKTANAAADVEVE